MDIMENTVFRRKLPIPQEVKKQYPLSATATAVKAARDQEIVALFRGEDSRLALIIGPCSADRADAVLDYVQRLAAIQQEVAEKLLIIPRVYTGKPRTAGAGYMGMLHQPAPDQAPDMLEGIVAIRQLHKDVIEQTGLTCADEMLYPHDVRYLSDLLSYLTVGARSVENQEHRFVASAFNVPVGMKNPTGGDLSVMLNAIYAAQHGHTFLYRGWEVTTQGNPLAHAVLRGGTRPNYYEEDLHRLYENYCHSGFENPSVIVDTNHANSGKNYLEQGGIAQEVLRARRQSGDLRRMVKGLMIESYLEDGCQRVEDGVYGKSITDPCLGWEKSKELIYRIAEML